MQLSFHLFKEHITDFGSAIKKAKLKGKHPFKPVTLKGTVPFTGEAYLQRDKTTAPPWLAYIQGHCEIDQPDKLLNRSCSFVLLVRRTFPPKNLDRIFAVTMGYGNGLLSEDDLEPDFGLKVTMNSVAEKKLRSIQARNFGTAPVQRHLVASQDSARTAFDIDSYLDLVASLEGIIKNADLRRTAKAKKNNKKLLGTRVSGSTSCSLTHDATFPELGDKCDKLWKAFNGNGYKKLFPEYDNVRLIVDSAKIDALNDLLGQNIKNRSSNNFCLALPDISARGMIDEYSIHHAGHKSGSMTDLSVGEMFAYLDGIGESGDDISLIHITGMTDGGGPATSQLQLHKCAVWEVMDGGDLHVLTLGRWYKVDTAYAKRKGTEFDLKVKGKVLSNAKYLPRYPKAIANQKPAKKGGRVEREGLYNEFACKQLGVSHYLMDKDFVRIDTSIEVCDIFTDKRHFIHVKRDSGNATMSHLLSQGSVSAKLFYESREYRAQLRDKLPKSLKPLVDLSQPNCHTFTVMYALIDNAVGFPKNLSFFKKLNLLHHQQVIEMMGYKVGYYHIPHE